VTEPALYGVTLKYRKPLYAAMISGGITGLFMGIVNLKAYAFAVPSVIALPQFIYNGAPKNIVYAVIVAVVSAILSFTLTLILGFNEDAPEAAKDNAQPATTATTSMANIDGGAKDTKKVFAPVAGELINIESVSDPTFAQKMMGDGAAIIPTDDHLYAPFDGTVETVFPTKHAIGLKSKDGVELLIHVGIDTVDLKGAHFTAHVNQGATVKQGDLLLDADLDAIKADGYDTTTMLVVTNTKDFVDVVPNEVTTVDKNAVALYVI
jgi:PTS system beta-glucosides-specific IIC component